MSRGFSRGGERSMFKEIEDDPFFENPMQRLSEFNQTMGSGHRAVEDGNRGRRGRSSQDVVASNDLVPSMFFEPFSYFRNMFGNFDDMMKRVARDGGTGKDGQCYMQSSVMAYSKDKDGKPRMYQAAKSTLHGPGGARETKKALRDTDIGLEKMSVGHHINQRGHTVTRRRDTRTDHVDEYQDLNELNQDDIHGFEDEWNKKMEKAYRPQHHGIEDDQTRGRRSNRPALEPPSNYERLRSHYKK